MICFSREEFIAQYVITRTSHKRKISELIDEAEYAWNRIHNSGQSAAANQKDL